MTVLEALFSEAALRLAPRALARELAPHERPRRRVRVAVEGDTIVLDAPSESHFDALDDEDEELVRKTWWAATLPPAPPRVLGVVNVTPDSFSDGGDHEDPDRAAAHGLALLEQGADALDVGGESTRPGAAPVDAATERARVVPVIERLRAASDAPIWVDTSKAAVAAAALDAGATTVNDVTAGRADPDLLPTVAERGADVVLMHMQGEPRTMQDDPTYDDVVAEVCEHLRARVAACLQLGIALPRILVDPGIGFGKRLEHNLALLRRLPELRSLGLPLVLGVSRKSFLGALTGEEDPKRREGATAAAVAACVRGGAEVLRVHDVHTMRQAIQVAAALRGGFGA